MQTNGQEHQQEQTQEPRPAPLQTSGDALAQTPPDSTQSADARLEAYLDAICALVPVEVSADSVEDMRQEMRGHLQAAIIAGEELGQTQEETVSGALAQFGEPQVVARHWQREWEATLAETAALPVWPSLKLALKIWAAADIVALAVCERIISMIYTNPHVAPGPLILSVLVVFPLITGAVIGLRARRHPVACTLAGCLLLMPLMFAGLTGVNYLNSYTYLSQTHLSLYYVMRMGANATFSCLQTWLILSGFSSGAVATGRRMRTRNRRQTA